MPLLKDPCWVITIQKDMCRRLSLSGKKQHIKSLKFQILSEAERNVIFITETAAFMSRVPNGPILISKGLRHRIIIM